MTPAQTFDGAGLTVGRHYRTQSGMGGYFDVCLTALAGGVATLRVHSPRNLDWHGHVFSAPARALYPIPQVFEVRTRVKPGEGHLVWGRYAERSEAEAQAERAARYASSRPVHVVAVEG